MTRASDASVVICAYDLGRWPDLVRAVQSVREQSVPADEILVVIDRNDELVGRAGRELDGVRVLVNAQAGGISGARNTGIDHARGEIVAFLDDDAEAEADWLEHLVAPYADGSVLGVGGQILPQWRFGRPAWFPGEFNWVVGCSYTGLPEVRSEVRNPIGASLSARRSVLVALGGFDPSMGRMAADGHAGVSGTADETELCIRASRRWPDHRWLYEPAARVHHVVPRSRLSWAFFVGRCRMEGTAKAMLSEIAGSARSLQSERRYVRRALPHGVARELTALRRGDRAAGARAAAILAGTTITALTYACARLRIVLRRHRDR